MQAISRFKIASSFPLHSEATFAQISEACGLKEPDVRRLLRHAMTKHIFCEPRKGVVVHTAASRLLAEDPQILDWVGASSDELWQAAAQTVNAMVMYPGSQEPNQTVRHIDTLFKARTGVVLLLIEICGCRDSPWRIIQTSPSTSSSRSTRNAPNASGVR